MLDGVRKYLPGKLGEVPTVIPVVRLQGAIGVSSSPFSSTLSLANVARPLDKAFSMPGPAVALIVNSPGGSPVQSRLIHNRIRSLAKQHDKEVLVFVEDVAASGGYMIAVAGDEIIADASSIVGSIGVIYAGFGFTGALDKLGIERRLHTAGENKALLDPFSPERDEDVRHLKAIQQEVHDDFIDLVKSRRGDVLSEAPDLFSGLFWTGTAGRDLGLVDSLGDLRSVLRARFGEEVKTRLVTAPRSLLGRRQGVGVAAALGELLTGRDQGAGLAEEAITALENRALWARFGL
ncbi:S49 family peptidase [Stappia indica]|uniref:S49 family peptidase n=1 Tax=Stappia indica TaxID=538381 RepID=UPI001CD1F68B|nr:S49 family peptidase [Stappia indica]MCA1297819.1 S49 family peptidase [Stappia indica]